MSLSSAINEADTSCTGIVLNAASEKLASAVLYSADFDLFERRIDKESGGYTCAYTDSEDEFCELLDMLSELALYGGVSVEETTASDIRARFASSSLLFGAVVPLGALEAEDYADMAGEVYIAPVPKLSAEDSYKTTLDGMARLGAINAKSSKIAQATAFLDYQSTHSQEVVEAYYRYELLFGFLSPEKENKESINLIASSFIPTCTSYYDGVVGGHFYSNCDQSATLAKLVSSLRFYISDPKIIWNETVLPRVDYITQIIALVEKLN